MKTLLSCAILSTALCGLSHAVAGQTPLPWAHYDADRGPPRVSMGDEGGQVLAHFPADCCTTRTAARLFSAFATSPDPVWVDLTRVDVPGAVASASGTAVHVSATRLPAELAEPGTVRLRRWNSSSSQPEWVYVHGEPAAADPWVGLSRDGAVAVLVSAHADGSGAHDVLALGAGGGLLSLTVVVPASPGGTLHDAELSADGSLAVLGLGSEVFVVDVLAGQVLQVLADPPGTPGEAVSLSADGAVLAMADGFAGTLRLFERAGSSWQLAHTWNDISDASSVAVALSADGRTLAASFGTFPFPGNTVLVLALDVPTRSVTMSDLFVLCCGIGYGPADLAITPDGSRFVVGLGGGDDLWDEERVRLYGRDQDAPLAAWETGTPLMTDVAISPDGQRVAVGCGYHEGGGLLYLFQVPGGDFGVEGAPRLGQAFEFVLSGAPGQQGVVLVSGAPAVPPLVLPGLGTLFLDPDGMLLLPMGPVAGDGSARLTVDVPSQGSLLGASLWAQGLLLPDEDLSSDWLKLTLLP